MVMNVALSRRKRVVSLPLAQSLHLGFLHSLTVALEMNIRELLGPLDFEIDYFWLLLSRGMPWLSYLLVSLTDDDWESS